MVELSPDEARAYLVHAHGLCEPLGHGAEGARAVLAHRRVVQLDPLDPIGTNADLVALARVDGLRRGGIYDALLPGHAFEHWAKERCLLPASVFPHWRARAGEVRWWGTAERLRRVDEGLVAEVLVELHERGPSTPAELTDRGKVDPLSWSGWKGTAKATTMALEVLWTRCDVVVAGRRGGAKVYDLPERALPDVGRAAPEGDFDEVALLERVEAAGLLPRAGGPWWGLLNHAREALPDRLVAEGRLEEVRLPGSRRTWLAAAGFRDRPWDAPDDRMRILGPLDPLIWDRGLVRAAFGFDYVWEVYKPAAQRRWGWYVCPLLHRGRLVGRLQARVVDGALVVEQRWIEDGAAWDEDAYRACVERHAQALGVEPP